MGTMPYGTVITQPSLPGTPTNSPWSPPPPPKPSNPQALATTPVRSKTSFEKTDLFILQEIFISKIRNGLFSPFYSKNQNTKFPKNQNKPKSLIGQCLYRGVLMTFLPLPGLTGNS